MFITIKKALHDPFTPGAPAWKVSLLRASRASWRSDGLEVISGHKHLNDCLMRVVQWYPAKTNHMILLDLGTKEEHLTDMGNLSWTRKLVNKHSKLLKVGWSVGLPRLQIDILSVSTIKHGDAGSKWSWGLLACSKRSVRISIPTPASGQFGTMPDV